MDRVTAYSSPHFSTGAARRGRKGCEDKARDRRARARRRAPAGPATGLGLERGVPWFSPLPSNGRPRWRADPTGARLSLPYRSKDGANYAPAADRTGKNVNGSAIFPSIKGLSTLLGAGKENLGWRGTDMASGTAAYRCVDISTSAPRQSTYE